MRDIFIFIIYLCGSFTLLGQDLNWQDTTFRSLGYKYGGNTTYSIDNYVMTTGVPIEETRDINTLNIFDLSNDEPVLIYSELIRNKKGGDRLNYGGIAGEYFWYYANDSTNIQLSCYNIETNEQDTIKHELSKDIDNYNTLNRLTYVNGTYYLVSGWWTFETDPGMFGYELFEWDNGKDSLIFIKEATFKNRDFSELGDFLGFELLIAEDDKIVIGFQDYMNEGCFVHLNIENNYYQKTEHFRRANWNAELFWFRNEENVSIQKYLIDGNPALAFYSEYKREYVVDNYLVYHNPAIDDWRSNKHKFDLDSTKGYLLDHLINPALFKFNENKFVTTHSFMEKGRQEYSLNKNGFHRTVVRVLEGNTASGYSITDAKIYEIPDGFNALSISMIGDSTLLFAGYLYYVERKNELTYLKINLKDETSIVDKELHASTHLYFHEGELVIDSDLQVKNWMVYDTMGKTLSSSNQSNVLPKGAYIVKVNFENGQEFQKFLYSQ